mgnify:CR=1 FL=1
MSVAVTGGRFRQGVARLSFAPRVGHENCKPFPSQIMGSVTRGLGISRPTRLPRLMTMGNLFSLVSEVAGIMIASTWRMSSVMKRKGER